MERPEDFEERGEQTSTTETYGTDTPATGGAGATPEENRDEAGRWSGDETPQPESETEESSTDS
jgi:hypothetical protein